MYRAALAIALAVVLAPVAAALAQEAGAGQGRMARIDRNGDGAISKDEWTGRPETFDQLDTNSDGKLDMSEMVVAREQARGVQERVQERGRERREERRGAGPAAAGESEQTRERVAGAAMFAGALFELIDTDRDGKLSSQEVDSFAAKVKEADADKDGFVTQTEAREYIRNRLAQRIGEAFMKRFDSDKDGKVTAEEFKGEARRFEWLDADKDGVITMTDFQKRGPEAPGPGEMRPRGQGREAREDRRAGDERGSEPAGRRLQNPRDTRPAAGDPPDRPRRERRNAGSESAE